MKRLLLLLLLSAPALAQTGNTVIRTFPAVPSGNCSSVMVAVNGSTGDFFDCLVGSWHVVAGGGDGGSGTVTSVSSGNLSPLFTVAVATPTVTPAFSFTASTFVAHTFYGNNTGSTATPTAATIGTGDLPGSGSITLNTTAPLGGGGSVPLGGTLTFTCTGCLTSAVTSIATTSPITGGTITGTGTIACATCVTASAPGAGIAHFAGGTQAATSSAVDVSSADITGVLKAAAQPAHTGDVTNSAGSLAMTIAAAVVSRTKETADGRGWAFCGTATAATVTVGPVNAATCCSGGTCRQFQIYYYIEGYSGGTPVGRLLMGPGTPSTTGLTNGNALLEGTTTITTTSVSVPGVPLAVTLSATSREGVIWIDGASGKFKRINIIGQEGAQSVSAAPVMFRAASNFSDLSTNLPLQQFQLTVYDTLTSTAASTNTFTAGTYLAVWGRNTD